MPQASNILQDIKMDQASMILQDTMMLQVFNLLKGTNLSQASMLLQDIKVTQASNLLQDTKVTQASKERYVMMSEAEGDPKNAKEWSHVGMYAILEVENMLNIPKHAGKHVVSVILQASMLPMDTKLPQASKLLLTSEVTQAYKILQASKVQFKNLPNCAKMILR